MRNGAKENRPNGGALCTSSRAASKAVTSSVLPPKQTLPTTTTVYSTTRINQLIISTMRRVRRFLKSQAEAVGYVLLSPESVALWPVAVCLSTALSCWSADSDEFGKPLNGFASSSSNNNNIGNESRRTATDEPLSSSCWSLSSTPAVVLCVILLYIGLVLVTNLVACYRFFYAWNTVVGSLHNNNNNNQQRRLPYINLDDVLRVERYKQQQSCCKTETTCPICLLEFIEQQWVTSCEEGCASMFHKDCLFEWLHHAMSHEPSYSEPIRQQHQQHHINTSCPCCRKELLQGVIIQPSAPPPTADGRPAWLSDLSTFMGYYVH